MSISCAAEKTAEKQAMSDDGDLLDLNATFNTVYHNVLLGRLEGVMGIRKAALGWYIKSHFSDKL